MDPYDSAFTGAEVDASVGPSTTVAPSGAAYTSIAAAVAAASANDTIFVYPGTYTETVTVAVNNLSIIGMGSPFNTTLTRADANVIDFGATTGGRIVNFTLNMSAVTTEKCLVQGSTGNFQVKQCLSMLTCATALNQADQPRIACVSGSGTIKFTLGKVIYNHTGACTTATAIKAPFEIATGGKILLYNLNEVDINCSGSAAITAIGLSVGTGYIIADYCDIDVDDDTCTSVVGLGYIASGTSNDNEFSFNQIHVHGAANNAYGAIALGGEIRSSHNHLHVECSAGGTAYSFSGGGGTVNSHMDDIIATGGYSGTVNIVSSAADGELTTSGAIFAGLKSGTDQADAGAAAGELYQDTNDDNTIKMGV